MLSSTAIANEKESDTWTVLLVSPISAKSIVLGKLVGLLRRLVWPTALIAKAPATRRWLPRPGAWMVTLREVLAFPLFGSASAVVSTAIPSPLYVLSATNHSRAQLQSLKGFTGAHSRRNQRA